jgi:opacity protein-like surface antigen
MNRLFTAALLLAVSASLAAAADSSKTKFLSVQLTSGTADFATELSSGFNGFAPAFDHSEYGFRAEYWNMMGPEYAFNASYGMGFFSEEDKPGTNAAPGDGTQKYTQSSWNVRIGGDRMLSVGDKSYIYFGPGIEYWSGKAKFEDKTAPGSSYETENVSRVSLGARIGGNLMIAPTWGITAQVGTKIGRATYKEHSAETTWWPSSMEGSVGVVFKCGS